MKFRVVRADTEIGPKQSGKIRQVEQRLVLTELGTAGQARRSRWGAKADESRAGCDRELAVRRGGPDAEETWKKNGDKLSKTRIWP